jgi:circadian clock protein KaiC
MKVSTGIRGLDKVLDGGIPQGSAIVLEGAPGTGKTTLAMQFLYKGIVDHGEPGIFFSFEEFPDQIYEDMKSYGWDLKDLERKNKLRVIGISPDIFLDQMASKDGLFEQLVREIDCRRIVIDSISLLEYLPDKTGENGRSLLYTLRNIVRKFGLTSLFIQELSSLDRRKIPFEHFIADGVIRLSLKEHMNIFRKRTLEVTKMRGTKINEGEHIYQITDKGIYLLLASQIVTDKYISDQNEKIKTGIPELDNLLGGGMVKGAVYMLDTNSKANYRHIVGAIYAERVKAGNRVLSLLSSTQTVIELKSLMDLYGIDIDQLARKKRLYFIEHYNRPFPAGWEGSVFHVQGMENEDYDRFLREKCTGLMKECKENHEDWFAYYDLSTIFNERGAEYVLRSFAKETAFARSFGMTVLVLCNFKEVGEQAASFLERTSNGVFKTWVDGSYQYLQVTKSPDGQISKPYLLESIDQKPYIRLV